MAHPYTTAARVRDFAVAQHVDHFLDRDGDGLADAGTMDGAIARACNDIDARLGFRFTVPLESLPSTPGKASDIADHLAVYYLIGPIAGWDSAEARRLLELAHADLTRIAEGDMALPGASPLSTQARRPVLYDTTRDCKYHGI